MAIAAFKAWYVEDVAHVPSPITGLVHFQALKGSVQSKVKHEQYIFGCNFIFCRLFCVILIVLTTIFLDNYST